MFAADLPDNDTAHYLMFKTNNHAITKESIDNWYEKQLYIYVNLPVSSLEKKNPAYLIFHLLN